MVGANAMLGEFLRVELPNLAREEGKWSLASATNVASAPNAASLDDPLKAHDNPAEDLKEGIISRDGGHFEAQFTSGAQDFAKAARELLRKKLPDLRFRISIDENEQQTVNTQLSTALPVLQPCEWTGRGLASKRIEQGSERPAVSLDVEQRHDAAKRTENGTAKDLASLLIEKTALKELKRAQEFKELVGNGYLALIHADGNNIGANAPPERNEKNNFFHRNRVLLRHALVPSINQACEDEQLTPLLPLMLGGDDLLVVCRADKALPFVVDLCESLAKIQHNTDNKELTLGIGVIIAKHTIPIHRLHELAEQLASSAKRLIRGENKQRSVVDWAVYTTTWLDDLEEVRQRDWLRGTTDKLRILSQRPLDVLGEGLDSLQGLLKGAEKLENAPRSQLQYLVGELSRGQTLSELAYADLSAEASSRLRNAMGENPLWKQINQQASITPLLDLVEVYEIKRLGRKTNTSAHHPTKESANG
tara:strand:- start:30270 stop:31703 length:1434 start_codon:yes stop_codon:yes gene_type:complete